MWLGRVPLDLVGVPFSPTNAENLTAGAVEGVGAPPEPKLTSVVDALVVLCCILLGCISFKPT